MSSYIPNATNVAEYWLRLATFLHQPLKTALLQVLHNKSNRTDYVGLPEDESDLYKELSSRMTEINKLVKDRVLNQKQVSLLLPPTKRTDSSTFDVTLIIVVIRNFTTLPPPTNGWRNDPSQLDIQTSDFVRRAQIWRNNFIHDTEPSTLSKAEFDKKWADGEYIVQGLGLTTFDTKNLKTINLDKKNELIMQSYILYVNKMQGKLDKEIATNKEHINSNEDNIATNREEIAKIEDRLAISNLSQGNLLKYI